jgi:DNA-binding NarL/FixJ family response regulator
MNRKITLAIVDDHPIVVQGLQMILTNNSDINVTGCFTSGSDFIGFLKSNEVDIVLLDVMLPDGNGMDICKEIKSVSPNTCVLALSNHSERSIVMQMLQNGASGYLLKNVSVQELTSCIYEALNGEVAFSKAVKEILARPSANDLKGIPQLTKREKEVLQLIAEGKTTALMAKHLFVSPLTIETHRRNLLQKFEVKNVASLIKIAADQGFLKFIG